MLTQETNIKEKLESSPFLPPLIKSKILALYNLWFSSEADPTKSMLDLLKASEQQIIKLFNANDDLAEKYKDVYDSKFK